MEMWQCRLPDRLCAEADAANACHPVMVIGLVPGLSGEAGNLCCCQVMGRMPLSTWHNMRTSYSTKIISGRDNKKGQYPKTLLIGLPLFPSEVLFQALMPMALSFFFASGLPWAAAFLNHSMAVLRLASTPMPFSYITPRLYCALS